MISGEYKNKSAYQQGYNDAMRDFREKARIKMSNSIAKEKPVTSEDCAHCVHKEVCRHREDYFGFVNAIDEFSERCFGDKICEDVASVKVSCNYYIPRGEK